MHSLTPLTKEGDSVTMDFPASLLSEHTHTTQLKPFCVCGGTAGHVCVCVSVWSAVCGTCCRTDHREGGWNASVSGSVFHSGEICKPAPLLHQPDLRGLKAKYKQITILTDRSWTHVQLQFVAPALHRRRLHLALEFLLPSDWSPPPFVS